MSGSISSLWHHGDPPVPDDLSVLWHTCTGASCEFCTMRSKNLIELRCFLKIAIHQVQCPPAVQLQAHFVEWN